MTHKWLADSIRSSSHLPYALTEGYELLQHQWMSLLVVQHPICCAERVPQIWHFVCHPSIDLGGKWYHVKHEGLVVAIRSSSYLPYVFKEGFETPQQQWLSLIAVKHPICHTERVPQIWLFAFHLSVDLGEKWHDLTHKGLVDAVRSSSHLSYAPKEGYETLQQQWLSLIVVHHLICCAVRIPQIWHFVFHLSIDLGGK